MQWCTQHTHTYMITHKHIHTHMHDSQTPTHTHAHTHTHTTVPSDNWWQIYLHLFKLMLTRLWRLQLDKQQTFQRQRWLAQTLVCIMAFTTARTLPHPLCPNSLLALSPSSQHHCNLSYLGPKHSMIISFAILPSPVVPSPLPWPAAWGIGHPATIPYVEQIVACIIIFVSIVQVLQAAQSTQKLT